MRSRFALLALLAGCTKEEGFDVLVATLPTPAVSEVVVRSAVGAGSVTIPILQLNTYGVPTGGGSASVLLEGLGLSTSSATVEFDAWGWAELTVSSSTPQEVTARLSSGGSAGSSWITAPLPQPTSLYPGWETRMVHDRVERVETGLVIQSGTALLWLSPTPGAQPVQFAQFQDAGIGGFTVADIDEDGLSDLAVWSGTEVHLLRGRSGGGFGWTLGYSVEHPVAGVAVGRVDEQLSRDLVIAWSDADAEEGGFQALSGDGAWGFEPTAPRTFETEIFDIAAGDWDGDGLDELAVMVADEDGEGEVVRYVSSADGWFATGYELGGGSLDAPLRPGSRVAPPVDINGDGLDELVLVGSPDEGARRPLAFYVFANDDTTLFQFDFSAYALAIGDLSGDGAEELVIAEADEDVLRLITSDSDDGTMKNRSVGAMVLPSALAVAELDDAEPLDLVSGEPSLLRGWPGELDETLTGRWDLRSEGWNLFALATSGIVEVMELDGDAQPEVLVVRAVSSTVSLQLLSISTSDEGALTIGGDAGDRVSVDEGGAGAATGLDLAVCGESVYVLVDDGDTWLYAVDMPGGAALELRAGVQVDATAIACGELDGGAVAAAGGGVLSLFDADLNPVGTQATSPDVGDLALVNLDGTGDQAQVCDTEGCGILAEDLDGDGLDEVVTFDGTIAWMEGWGTSWSLGGTGIPSVLDYDGDGLLDVVLTDLDLGVVFVYRTLDGAQAPPVVLHTRKALGGKAMPGDVDGDGVQELLFAEPEGGLYFSDPSTL